MGNVLRSQLTPLPQNLVVQSLLGNGVDDVLINALTKNIIITATYLNMNTDVNMLGKLLYGQALASGGANGASAYTLTSGDYARYNTMNAGICTLPASASLSGVGNFIVANISVTEVCALTPQGGDSLRGDAAIPAGRIAYIYFEGGNTFRAVVP